MQIRTLKSWFGQNLKNWSRSVNYFLHQYFWSKTVSDNFRWLRGSSVFALVKCSPSSFLLYLRQAGIWHSQKQQKCSLPSSVIVYSYHHWYHKNRAKQKQVSKKVQPTRGGARIYIYIDDDGDGDGDGDDDDFYELNFSPPCWNLMTKPNLLRSVLYPWNPGIL